MSNRITLTLTLLLGYSFTNCFSQRIYTVGDTIPDIYFKEILNGKTSSAKFSDLKKKIVILDFWATWCAPCVSFLSKADSLEKQFHGKVTILPITYEAKQVVAPFLEKFKTIKKVLPETVINDDTLRKMFPHTFLPHEVWVDESHVVRAITGSEDVSYENINSYLAGKGLNLISKIDGEKAKVDFNKPILTGRQSQFINPDITLYTSVITNYDNRLVGMSSIAEDFIGCYDVEITKLYKVSFGEARTEFLSDNRVLFEVEDSLLNQIRSLRKMSNSDWDIWKQQNTYCYELNVKKPQLIEKKFKIMQQDLNRYFGATIGICGTKEKRKVKCLILTKNNDEIKLLTKGGKSSFKSDRFSFEQNNRPFSFFVSYLQGYYLQNYPMPLIDETSWGDRNVDLNITCDLSNVDVLNKELKKYNLQIEEKEKEIEMIIIRRTYP